MVVTKSCRGVNLSMCRDLGEVVMLIGDAIWVNQRIKLLVDSWEGVAVLVTFLDFGFWHAAKAKYGYIGGVYYRETCSKVLSVMNRVRKPKEV
jgi:hypothetical protein